MSMLVLFVFFLITSECSSKEANKLTATNERELRFKRQLLNCGGILTSSSGTIQSPNYPNAFPPTIKCHWHIKVDHGYSIQIQFNWLQLSNTSCDNDYVQIYNGPDNTSEVISKLCNLQKPSVVTFTTENQMFIEFRSHSNHKGNGFLANYTTVPTRCGGIYHDREEIIDTRDYPHNTECLWEIWSSPGYYIRLHFIEKFQIAVSDECTNDYVEVWNWQDDKWISIAKECGRNIPNAVQSTADRLKILFRSNNRGNGFKAKWEWLCGGTLEATDVPRTLVSPGYPTSYEGNLNCVYRILSKIEAININFDDFELENGEACEHSNITFAATEFTRYRPLSKLYCGAKKPFSLRVGHNITVTFRTIAFSNKKGFKFTYKHDGCLLNITQASITKGPSIETEVDYDRYDMPEISCSWNITAPPKQIVIVRIIYLNVQISCYGAGVVIFKGLIEKREDILAWLCENVRELEPIFTDSKAMSIKLFSNAYYYRGFTAQIYFSPGPDVGCGGTINLTETKHIQAPDLEDLDCSWKIRAPRDHQIQVHFTELNLPGACTENSTTCSFVEIHDGLAPFAKLIEKLDSSSNGKSKYSKFSTSLHGCYIRFVLKGRRSKAFKATLTPVLSKCGPSILDVTTEKKILTSPGYPNKYPSGIVCTWELQIRPPMYWWYKIELHFIDFNLTSSSNSSHVCNNDKVIITEDPHRQSITEGLGMHTEYTNTSGRPINLWDNYNTAPHTFCGNSVFDYFSVGKSLTLTFKSPLFAEQSRGFKLEYGVVGCHRNYASPQGRLYSAGQNTDCVITITVPKNRTISLYFYRFYTYDEGKCNITGFKVKDGGPDGKVLSHYCEFQLPNPVFSFSNKLYITVYKRSTPFTSVTYDVLYTSTDTGRGCGGELYNHKGRVSSPLYPNKFRNDTVCRWVIRVPVGLYTALKFTNFDIQGSCDQTYVRITTYLNNNKLVRTFCQNDQPAILRSNSQIDIEYRSSAQNGGSGWLAIFQGVESETVEVH